LLNFEKTIVAMSMMHNHLTTITNVWESTSYENDSYHMIS